MKIALSQINLHIGNFEFNCSKIEKNIQKAENDGCDLIIFPELSVSGYPPLDLLEYKDFIERCYESINKIAKSCKNVAAIVGSPSYNKNKRGRPLYNSAFFLVNGKIEQVFHKGLLPNYDVFDEYRYFEPSESFNIINYKGYNLAVTICEDLWSLDNKTLYVSSPMEQLSQQQPDLLINIAASPFTYNHHLERKSILAANAVKYNLPLIYVNHTGAHSELLFDGGSMTFNPGGGIVHEMEYFKEDYHITTIDSIKSSGGRDISTSSGKYEKIKLIHDGLITGIKDYFDKSGFKRAVLGLSGGLDSAVVMVLAIKALGKDNVKALLMPSQFSSKHSVNDAVDLATTSGVSYDILPIKEIYYTYDRILKPYFKNYSFDSTEENIQARARAILLMAYSNKFEYVLLNTSNKSEAAVGYSTLYGDMCGGLSVLGDVYKSDIYNIAAYINGPNRIIPQSIIDKPPSAELRPEQKDTDSLPEYGLLDDLLYNYIELQLSPDEIIKKGFEPSIVNEVISMVNKSEYKRAQSPPILRVSSKAFGIGRRMPIVAKYM